jgi:hypothetical protein
MLSCRSHTALIGDTVTTGARASIALALAFGVTAESAGGRVPEEGERLSHLRPTRSRCTRKMQTHVALL